MLQYFQKMFDRDDDEFSQDEIVSMVRKFEEAREKDIQAFFDHSAFEYIIDYYEDQREYLRALEAADAGLDQYPYSSSLLTKKAQLLAEERRYDEASEILDKAEAFDPNEVNIYLVRADVSVWRGDHNLAISHIRHALTICDPDEKDDIYLEMADVYEDWEKYLEVIDCLKQALSLNPANEEALNRLWFCYELTEDYDDSIAFHKSFIEEEPYAFLAWFNLAHAYSGLALFERAREAFDYVIAINEHFESAYTDCGDLLYNQQEYSAALEYYLDAVRFSRIPRKEIFVSVADCYTHLEEYKQARYYLRKATNIDPNFGEAFHKIGDNYRREERWDKSESFFERAVKLGPKETEYMTSLADAYFNLGKVSDALELYHKVVDMDPRDRDHWINLAAALFDAEAFEESLSVLDKSEKLFADNAYIYYIKAAFQYHLGHRNEAMVNLQKGLLKNYDDHNLLFSISPEMETDDEVLQLVEQYRNN